MFTFPKVLFGIICFVEKEEKEKKKQFQCLTMTENENSYIDSKMLCAY